MQTVTLKESLGLLRHLFQHHFDFFQWDHRETFKQFFGLKDDELDALKALEVWIADHGLEYAVERPKPGTVWTLSYGDELTTCDEFGMVIAVIDVFASLGAAQEYVRNSADLTVDTEEQTSPVEYRMSGDALGESGRFLIVLREEIVKS